MIAEPFGVPEDIGWRSDEVHMFREFMDRFGTDTGLTNLGFITLAY